MTPMIGLILKDITHLIMASQLIQLKSINLTFLIFRSDSAKEKVVSAKYSSPFINKHECW